MIRKLTEITVFDKLKYGNSIHPKDVLYYMNPENSNEKRYSVYREYNNADGYYDTLKELVEDQNCSYEWYCYYYNIMNEDI